MAKQETLSILPEEVVMNKIYVFRGHKVMLDRDLSELYGIETRVLKQAVRRNINRFPDDLILLFEIYCEIDSLRNLCLRCQPVSFKFGDHNL